MKPADERRAASGAIAFAFVLSALAGCSVTPVGAPQSGPVFDAMTAATRSAYEKAEISDVRFDVDPVSLSHDRALTEAMTAIHYTERLAGRTRFTTSARAASSDCRIYSRPGCREFVVASMRFEAPLSMRFVVDDTNRIDSIEMQARVRSRAVGSLGIAVAKSRGVYCLTGAGRRPWQDSSSGTSLLMQAFSNAPAENNGDTAPLLAGLLRAQPRIVVSCPVDPNELSRVSAEIVD